MSCPNLAIPQIRKAVDDIGFSEVKRILDRHFDEDSTMPTYAEIVSYKMPKKLKESYNRYSVETLKKITKGLSKKFGLGIRFDPNMDRLGAVNADGTISINPNKATMDTPFHEFAHPLVNLLEKENRVAYNALKRSAMADKESVELVEMLYGDYTDIAKEKEIMAQHLGKESYKAYNAKEGTKKNFFQKLWEYFRDAIRSIFGPDVHVDIDAMTTMGDLVNLLTNDEKLDLDGYISEESQRDPKTHYANIYAEANDLQKEVLDSMSHIINAGFMVNAQINKYTSLKYPSKQLDRVTEKLQEEPDIAYEGEDSEGMSLSIDWGNAIDYVLGEAFTNGNPNDVIDELRLMGDRGTITNQVVMDLFAFAEKYKADHPGSLFLAQVTPFNLSKNVAGSIDIIEVTEDGKTFIHDFKSSINPTQGEQRRVSKAGNEYVWKYDKQFKNKKSLKQKHEAQLSYYAGLLKSKGVQVDGMSIIPIYLSKIEGDTVVEVEMEPVFSTMEMTFDESYTHTLKGANDEQFAEEDQITEEEDKEARSLHDLVLLLLEDEKKYLEKSGGAFSRIRIRRLENIQNDIKTVKSVVALERAVNSLHEMFVSYTNKNGETVDANFRREAKEVFRAIQTGKITDDFEKMAYLNAISERVALYKDTMIGLRKFFATHKAGLKNEVQKGSAFDKIREIVDSFEDAEVMVSKLVKPTIAKTLSKMENTNASQAIEDQVALLAGRMNKAIERTKKKYLEKIKGARNAEEKNDLELEMDAKISKTKAKFSAQIDNFLGSMMTEDNLLALMENGYQGVGWADSWLTPVAHYSNPLVSGFYKTLKREYALVRDDLQRWGVKTSALIRKLDKRSGILENSKKINEDLITEVDGKLYLISDIDYQKFNDARKEAFAKIDQSTEDKRERILRKRDWNATNKDQISYEDVTMVDPYTGKELVLRKGINTLINEKREELAKEYGSPNSKYYQDAYAEWLDNVSTLDPTTGQRYFTGRAFTIPSKRIYGNTKFEQVYNANKEYYDAILATYIRAYSNYPLVMTPQSIYRLPAVPKGLTDRLTENGIMDALGHFGKTTFRHMAELRQEEAEIYGSDAFGTEHKTIPMMYHDDNIESSEISRDLIASAGVFLQAAERFTAQSKVEPLANSLLREMKNAKELNQTADGRKKIFRMAEELGLSLEKYEKKWGNNYTAMALESFIDAEIYGIRQKKEVINAFGKEVNAGKLANFLMATMSWTTIAAKPLVAIANGLQQNVMLLLEGAAGEYVSLNAYRRALVKYESYEGQFMQDMVDGNPNSLIGQLTSLYDPYIGKFKDHFGRQISSTGAKRLMQGSSLYYMMHKADHQIYVTSMIALLMDKKVKNNITGEEVSLMDAYELVDGVLELKEGIDLGGSRIDMELKEKMDAMNQRLHGVYNELDKSMAEKYAVGRLGIMFRKFAITGAKKRFKRAGVDHNTGTITEGFYTSFLRLAVRETHELMNFLLFKENDLSPTERANVKRFLVEVGLAQLLIIALGLLGSMYEDMDDDDKRKMGYLMYFTYRLKSELMFYRSFGDFSRIMQSPSVTYSQIGRISKFLKQLSDPMEEFETPHSFWERGDNKTWAYFLKVFGINGYTIHPEQAYENLVLYSGGK